MPGGGRERGVWIDFSVSRRRARLQEEALQAGRVEEHNATPQRLADVAPRVDRSPRHMDCLPRGQPRPLPLDFHLEFAFKNVDRLGFVLVPVPRQRPASRRLIYEQAKGAAGLVAVEMN